MCMINDDPKFSADSLSKYREFADKFACPTLLGHFARFVNLLTCHVLKGSRHQPHIKFDRF